MRGEAAVHSIPAQGPRGPSRGRAKAPPQQGHRTRGKRSPRSARTCPVPHPPPTWLRPPLLSAACWGQALRGLCSPHVHPTPPAHSLQPRHLAWTAVTEPRLPALPGIPARICLLAAAHTKATWLRSRQSSPGPLRGPSCPPRDLCPCCSHCQRHACPTLPPELCANDTFSVRPLPLETASSPAPPHRLPALPSSTEGSRNPPVWFHVCVPLSRHEGGSHPRGDSLRCPAAWPWEGQNRPHP